MKKTFKKYFIPHKENDHKPHFLREPAVLTTALIVVVIFFAGMLGKYEVKHNHFLASIQSAFLVDLANEDRVDNGLNALAINDKLVNAAEMKAGDMSQKGYFAHVSPEGVTPWFWISKAGYNYLYAGENLAVNFDNSNDVEDAWMNSPTHKANILSNKFTDIGIATAEGVYKGENTIFVVQEFGSQRHLINKVVETPKESPKVSVENKNTPAVQNQVLGEETSIKEVEASVPNTTSNVPVTASSAEETGITVTTNPDAAPEELNGLTVDNNSTKVVYTNWFERMIVSPSKVVHDLYLAIAAVVIFALILKIFIEIRLQHPKNIAYGVLLLALVIFFMHLNSSVLATPTLVMGL